MSDRAIGVFDSGVGGLTTVKELVKLLPNENIVYLGDTARVPYGTKSRDTIAKYARQDIEFLLKNDVKMILVACGTISSAMMHEPIFEGVDVPYSGVVLPTAKAACDSTKNKRIGVLGTSATIKSKSFENAIKDIDDSIQVTAKACPMFVSLVENGYTAKDCLVTKLIAQEYLEIMKKDNVDTLILGCTHFPHLSEIIQDIMGDSVKLISSGAELAKFAVDKLLENGDENDSGKEGIRELYCTDSVELFTENTDTFLGKDNNARISKCILKT
ncbi:MAG: glutamate racemase [Ruminococcus sp.]|nr:glutamate racemase [Ruminococcus sp.]